MFCLHSSQIYTICMLGACQGQRHRISPAVELQMVVSLLVSAENRVSCFPARATSALLRHLSTTPTPYSPLCNKFTDKQKQKDHAIIRQFSQDLRPLYSPALEEHTFNPNAEKQTLMDLSSQPGLFSKL